MPSKTLLTLRRPTTLTSVIQSVPIPKNALPTVRLPIWETLPLDQKLPVPQIPKGLVVYSKGKLGHKLYKQRSKNGQKPPFVCRPGVPPAYDALYDPHLRDHLRTTPLSRTTPQCTLKEFNEHRKRLAEIRALEINQKLSTQDGFAKDIAALKKVDREMEKFKERYKKEQQRKLLFIDFYKEQEALKMEQLRRCEEIRNGVELRVKRVKQNKEEKRQNMAEKFRLKEQNFKKRLEASEEIENMNKVMKLKKRRINEKKVAKANKMKIIEEENKIRENQIARWNERCRLQTEQIAHNAEVLRAYQAETSCRVAHAERTRARQLVAQKKQFEQIREETGPLDNWNFRTQREKDLASAITKLWISNKTHILKRHEFADFESSISRELMQEVVECALLDNRDMLSVMRLAQQRLQKWKCVPMPVLMYMKNLLNTAVAKSTKNTVTRMLQSLLDDTIRKLKLYLGIRRKISTSPQYMTKTLQQEEFQKVSSHLSQRMTHSLRSVNFGEVQQHEVKSPSQDMLSAKYRPPTPRPSFDHLVDALLCQTDEDWDAVSNQFPILSEMDISLIHIKTTLKDQIDKLIDSCIENANLISLTKGEKPVDHMIIIHRITTIVCNNKVSNVSASNELFQSTARFIAFDALHAINMHVKHHPSPERLVAKGKVSLTTISMPSQATN